MINYWVLIVIREKLVVVALSFGMNAGCDCLTIQTMANSRLFYRISCSGNTRLPAISTIGFAAPCGFWS
jgi:hypothetical protein